MDEEENIVRECIIKKVDKNKKGVVHIIDIHNNNMILKVFSKDIFLLHDNYKKYKCCFEKKRLKI